MNPAQMRLVAIVLLLAGLALLGWRFRDRLLPAPPPFARIKVQKEVVGQSGVEHPASAYDADFVRAQMSVVQSDEILRRTVERLRLPDPTAALSRFHQQLRLKLVPDTALIDVHIANPNVEDSAKMANALAETYRDYVADRRQQRVAGAVRAQEEEWDRQSQEITNLESQVMQMRLELSVVNNAPANPYADTNKVQAWRDLEAKLKSLRQAREEFEADAFHRMIHDQKIAEPLVEIVRPALAKPLVLPPSQDERARNLLAAAAGALFCAGAGGLWVFSRRRPARPR